MPHELDALTGAYVRHVDKSERQRTPGEYWVPGWGALDREGNAVPMRRIAVEDSKLDVALQGQRFEQLWFMHDWTARALFVAVDGLPFAHPSAHEKSPAGQSIAQLTIS